MAQLPGIPPIVTQAERTLSTRNRHIGRWGFGGLVLAMAVLVLGVMLESALVFPLALLVAAAGFFMGLFTSGVSEHEVKNAKAVLRKWSEMRDFWAHEAIEASMDDTGAEVQAYNEAVPRLQKLQSQKDKAL